jgi:hypothetical protein
MIRYKASNNQIRFYNREKSKKEAFLNISLLYNIEEEIRLEELVKYLVDINEVFRTYILIENEIYYQVIKDSNKVDIITSYIHTHNLNILKELSNHKFNLDYNEENNEALIKFSIIKVLDIVYLHIVVSHMCFDIYSETILLEQIKNYYNGIYYKADLNYIKYTKDEENENKEEYKNWWINYIGENTSWVNSINIKGKTIAISSNYKLGYEKLSIEELKKYCRNKRLLLFPFILSIFQLYIYKIFNLSKTNIRIPVYNRNKNYLQNTIGCVYNFLYIIRDVNNKDITVIYKENIKDITELNNKSMYSCEEIKKYFSNQIKDNQYVLSVLDNTNSLDTININNKKWTSLYIEENLNSDIYIEIWKNELYIKYNSVIFNTDNLKLEILKDLLTNFI